MALLPGCLVIGGGLSVGGIARFGRSMIRGAFQGLILLGGMASVIGIFGLFLGRCRGKIGSCGCFDKNGDIFIFNVGGNILPVREKTKKIRSNCAIMIV